VFDHSGAARAMAAQVALVVPCYNDEVRLRPEVFGSFFRECPARLMFVDDGSVDGTGEVLRSICQQFPRQASLLRLPQNVGKAEAVRTGVVEALDSGASFVGFWDADLATPLDSLMLFLAEFQHRPYLEMVFGSRVLMLGHTIERHSLRHYTGRGIATLVSAILKLPVYDTQCGAKLFRATTTLRSIFATPFLSRWVFDVEILARLIVEQLRTGGPPPEVCVKELPLPTWRDVKGSKIRPRDAASALTDLWRIHRWLRRARAAAHEFRQS
jgi:dolichyl-phosphate beta-glucosyltransferase